MVPLPPNRDIPPNTAAGIMMIRSRRRRTGYRTIRAGGKHAPQTAQGAANDIGNQGVAPDINAQFQGRLVIIALRFQLAAKTRVAHDIVEHDHCRYREIYEDRYAQKGLVRELKAHGVDDD